MPPTLQDPKLKEPNLGFRPRADVGGPPGSAVALRPATTDNSKGEMPTPPLGMAEPSFGAVRRPPLDSGTGPTAGGQVSVARQPNGVLAFSGGNVRGDVSYTGNEVAGFRPRGAGVNTMSAENFASASPSTLATLGAVRRTAMDQGNLDGVGFGFRPGSQNATVMSGETYGVLGRQNQADELLRDAMTKRPGESRADFATRSGAAQRALGFQVDERNNVRSNYTQRRGQDLNFDATTQGQGLGFTSNALDRASRERIEAARLGMDAGRLQLDTFKALHERKDAPSGYRWAENGSLAAIPGGPADLKRDGKLTEDQGKSAGYAARMANALNLIDSIGKSNPGATRPGAGTALLNMLPEGAANLLRPDDRQRVEAAQLDALDAALTLNTGAAYTREQLQGMTRSYFAQPGDSDQTVAEKQQRLASLIETARLRAGPQGSQMADAVVQRSQQQAAPATAQPAAPAVSPQLQELQRRAASNPELAQRLKDLGY